MSKNSIQVLELRRMGNTWVFDDLTRGVVNEPFVAGVPTIIDHLLKKKGITERTIHAFFSDGEFPDADICLTFIKEELHGAWYKFQNMKGWFCPCFWKYFDKENPPMRVYIKLER
jgi:hypothetical protein